MKTRMVFAPDGGDGGGGSGAPPAPPAGGNPPPAPPAGGEFATRPDWLPEQFYNPETKGPRIKEMAKAFVDARTTISKGVDGYKATFEAQEAERIAKIRPADPAGYKVALPGDLGKKFQVLTEKPGADFKPEQGKQLIQLDAQSPMYKWWAQTAHKLGLGQEDFNAGIASFIEDHMSRAPNYEAELAKLGEKGQARVQAIDGWMKANLTEADYKALEAFGQTAAGVQAIENMIKALGGNKLIDTGNATPPSDKPVTQADIDKAMKDPRYWNGDKAYQEEVSAMFRKLYPGKVSATGTVTATA